MPKVPRMCCGQLIISRLFCMSIGIVTISKNIWVWKRHLSEELLHQGHGPPVVQLPAFGWVADVCCMENQGHGFGSVDPVKPRTYSNDQNKVTNYSLFWVQAHETLIIQKKITYPSGCCKLFLIFLICWKWPDMSVDKTISITRFRRSLCNNHQKE